MSLKEKLLDKIEEKAILEYDAKICEDLQRHLSSFSIKPRTVFPGTSECIHGRVLLEFGKLLIGCLKVEDLNFNQIDVVKYAGGGGKGGGTYTLHYYGYVVHGRPEENWNDFKVQIKAIKKGLLSRELTGFEWRGGSLAERLNSDLELASMVKKLREDAPGLGIGGVFVGWGTTFHVYASRTEDFVTFWHPLRNPTDLPSREDIDIANRACMHIRSMIQASI